MEPTSRNYESAPGTWDDEHVKALLHFPRFPIRLIQQDPWQSWIGQRGGLKAVFAYLQTYPFMPTHRRILDVVISNPEAVADVYAVRLNISRATYFYQLRELIPAVVQALNHWETDPMMPVPVEIPASLPILPTPLTALVGAEPTLQAVSHMLMRNEVRLLTLLGPGGIGKTRISLELAHRFNGQAGFVDLSGLQDSAQVGATIAQTLGIKDRTDNGLKTWFSTREFLLVLDNFEQILPARSLVTALLMAAPRLKIIVTSRIALHAYGEYEYVIPPLAMSDIETIKEQQLWAQSPAVALFVQRAQAVSPNFVLNNENVAAVAELCLQTEGLPLAIELAAYQVKYFTPQAMLAHLSTARLDFLSQAPKRMPPHQQTLRATFDWSFNLLPQELQTLFCKLAAFDGSFTLADAASVCPGETAKTALPALMDHSLLEKHAGKNNEPCFQMLNMAREYAQEKLTLTAVAYQQVA